MHGLTLRTRQMLAAERHKCVIVCSIAVMQTDGQTTRDELILVWLRSEWERVDPPKPPDTQLIDNPDLTDQA